MIRGKRQPAILKLGRGQAPAGLFHQPGVSLESLECDNRPSRGIRAEIAIMLDAEAAIGQGPAPQLLIAPGY